MDNKSNMLMNCLEDLVRIRVKELMEESDICQCEKCRRDVCAIVLNSLDPRYVTTEKGLLFSLLSATDTQYKTDLTVSIVQAIKIVKEAPQH